MAETGLGCLSKERAELVQVPFQPLSAALCPHPFQNPVASKAAGSLQMGILCSFPPEPRAQLGQV